MKESTLQTIDGWVIAMVGARTFVGRPARTADDKTSLHPVYELSVIVQPQRQGIAVGYQVLPVLMMPSIKCIVLPDDAILIAIDEMSAKERNEIARNVFACEDTLRQMRAQAAGVVVDVPHEVAQKIVTAR